jgi:hypothetical protein
MMKKLVLIVFLILAMAVSGCKSEQSAEDSSSYTRLEDVNGFRCADGRLVTDGRYCNDIRIEPEISIDTQDPSARIEPEKVKVYKSSSGIDTKTSAREAFQGYAFRSGFDYKIISSEMIEEKDGVTYYRVRYEHDEKSGGRRNAIIDSEGNIYQEVGLP